MRKEDDDGTDMGAKKKKTERRFDGKMMEPTWVRRIRQKEDWLGKEDDGTDMSAKKKTERRLDEEGR